MEGTAKNLPPPRTEDEPRSSGEVTISEEEESIRSDESEDIEKMQDGPIDIEQYDFVTGAQMRMQNAISEERDILEREEPIHRKTAKRGNDQDHRRPGKTGRNIQRNAQRNDT